MTPSDKNFNTKLNLFKTYCLSFNPVILYLNFMDPYFCIRRNNQPLFLSSLSQEFTGIYHISLQYLYSQLKKGNLIIYFIVIAVLFFYFSGFTVWILAEGVRNANKYWRYNCMMVLTMVVSYSFPNNL